MKVIYIAGPYRAANAWEVERNIRAAEEVALRVAEIGAVPLCPHSMTRFFHGTLTEDYWLEATQELLKLCDGVLLVDYAADIVSEGTRSEVNLAHRLSIPVFRNMAYLPAWIGSDDV